MSRFTRVTNGDTSTQRAVQELQDELARLRRELDSLKASNNGSGAAGIREEMGKATSQLSRRINNITITDVIGNSLAGAYGAAPFNPILTGGGNPGDVLELEELHGFTTLDFGAAPGSSYAETVISGLWGVSSPAMTQAWIVATATADHSVEEHTLEAIEVGIIDVVPNVGFTIIGTPADGTARLTGEWSVAWAWRPL